jgi:hypothetical protein
MDVSRISRTKQRQYQDAQSPRNALTALDTAGGNFMVSKVKKIAPWYTAILSQHYRHFTPRTGVFRR